MSHESDADRTASVSDDEVSVEKSFAEDEFPVPAIKFRLASESDDPVHIRLVDQIPEDFPMEGVGFHPDYESDNWTAYKDHRVEYERTLDPGEETTTVYGIRLEQASDVEGFLGDPILERPPAPEEGQGEDSPRDVEDILGTDRSQLVRDALQGNGRLAVDSEAESESEPSLPDEEPAPGVGESDSGIEEPGPTGEEPTVADDDPESAPEAEATASTGTETADDPVAEDAPSPRELGADLAPASRRREDDRITSVTPGESGGRTEEDADDETQQEATGEEEIEREAADEEEVEPEAADAEEIEREVDDDGTVEEHVDAPGAAAEQATEEEAEPEATDAEPTAERTPVDAEGGLAATLASEIRAGEVSESDLETLRGELDAGLPRSADVRIRRVQAQMEDLNAYADAIAEFIDEEGTGAELVERLDAELTEINEELDDLRAAVDAADDERAAIRESVGEVESDVDAVDERLGEVAGELDDVAEEAKDAAAGVDELHDRADGIEERLDRTTDRVDEVDSAVRDVSADVDDVAADVDDVAGEVENVASDIDETGAHVSRLDEEMGDVREDIAAIDGDVVETRESLEAELDDLRAEVSALSNELDRIGDIEREIEELQQFRDRLNSAFGPGE
jgi:peptidoglycan hydrolase CwlO-like protein